MAIPVMTKPQEGTTYVAGMNVIMKGDSITETLTPTAGVITLTKDNPVACSEIIKKSDGTTLVYGTNYTYVETNGFIPSKEITLIEITDPVVVTYTYGQNVLAGSSGLTIDNTSKTTEIALDCSYRTLTLETGLSISASVNDVIYEGDSERMSLLSGSYIDNTKYTRYASGRSKSISLIVFSYDEEGEIAYGNSSPKQVTILDEARVTSQGRATSEGTKSLSFSAQKIYVIDYKAVA